ADSFSHWLSRSSQRRLPLDSVVENLRARSFLQINAMERIGDDAILDLHTIASHEDCGVVIEQLQTRASDSQFANRYIVGGDRNGFSRAVAANFRVRFTDKGKRFVNNDRPGMNACFDAHSFTRCRRVDAFLRCRRSGIKREAKRDSNAL